MLLAYCLFGGFMLQIVLQYLPAQSDTAFLGIKQDYVHLPFYLAAFYIHVFTAILALPAGFTQFSPWLLKHHPAVHRLNGKIYVLSIVLLGAPSGFLIGMFANGGLISRISFCTLALLWIVFTYLAYQKAIQKKFRQHEAFMYRSFALTLSAISLRAWKYILVGIFHPHPMDVYRLIAWLGWVPNLMLAEYLIYKKRNK